MNKSKTFSNNNRAASPVIGVMLMVVVTVILAAAVTAYTGGFIGSEQIPPSAAFEIQIKKSVDINGENISYMKIKEISGDSIKTKEIMITTSYMDEDNVFHLREVSPNEPNTFLATDGTSIQGVSPYLNNKAKGKFGEDDQVDFGNFVLKSGGVMIAQTNEDYMGSDDTGMEAMIDDWSNVKKGDFIDVSIKHIPSNKLIFSAEVEVV